MVEGRHERDELTVIFWMTPEGYNKLIRTNLEDRGKDHHGALPPEQKRIHVVIRGLTEFTERGLNLASGGRV